MAAQPRAGLHRHAGAEHHKRLDLHVILHHRVMGEEHRFRRGHGDAVLEQPGAKACLEFVFRLRQFGAAIDARDRDFVRHRDGAGNAVGARQGGHIGEIIFLLGVVVFQLLPPSGRISAHRRRSSRHCTG